MAGEVAVEPRGSATGNVRLGRKVTAKASSEADALAALMAEGCPTVSEAARRLNLTQSRADQLWQRIRRDLGQQAA